MNSLKIKIIMQYVCEIEELACEAGATRHVFDLQQQLILSNKIREIKKKIKKELEEKEIDYNDFLKKGGKFSTK